MHLKSKPSKCELCDNDFRLKDHLHLHINNVHKEQKNHKCKFCQKEFSSDDKFRYHKVAVH